jgi:serine/threonine protein kinase
MCPYCCEVIIAAAVKCRFCQTMLDGSVNTPQGTTPGGATPMPGQPAWAIGGAIAAGTMIREYRFEALLGKGGMGEVYRANHTFTGQQVAIKVLYADLMRDEQSSRRFIEEGRVMAGLRHPNIVEFANFFEESGRYFLVMEFIDGETLDNLLDRRPLSVEEAIQIADAVLSALEFAHSRSQPVIHRDIKPANIMLSKDGRVVVADFGIAKAIGREKLTRTQGVVGTYEYMSPEQVRGDEVSFATDLYAFGVTLYKMLTGVVPFPQKSDTGIDCMNAHLTAPVPPIAEFREGLPDWLQAVLDLTLAKVGRERYASAGELKSALLAGGASRPARVRQPSVASPASGLTPLKKPASPPKLTPKQIPQPAPPASVTYAEWGCVWFVAVLVSLLTLFFWMQKDHL